VLPRGGRAAIDSAARPSAARDPRRLELAREQLMHQSDVVINLSFFALSQPRVVLRRDVVGVILQRLVVTELSRNLPGSRDNFPRGLEEFLADRAHIQFDVVGNEMLNPHVSAPFLEWIASTTMAACATTMMSGRRG
jgi:hypothetical protein